MPRWDDGDVDGNGEMVGLGSLAAGLDGISGGWWMVGEWSDTN